MFFLANSSACASHLRHSSPAGQKYGYFVGEDEHTTSEGDRLVRLPLYYGLTREDQARVIAAVQEFYGV